MILRKEQGGKKITSWKSKLQDLRVTSVGLEDLKLDWNRAAKIVLVSPEVDMGCSLQNPFGVTLQNEEISIAGVEIAGGDPLDSIEGESPEDLKNDSVECREAMSSFLSEKLVVLAYSVPSVSKGAIKSYTVKLDLTH